MPHSGPSAQSDSYSGPSPSPFFVFVTRLQPMGHPQQAFCLTKIFSRKVSPETSLMYPKEDSEKF
jgi:hypothetical protein